MAEALIASMVLCIVAASCMLPLSAAARQTVEAEQLRHATEIGQALMDEIAARPVSDSRVADFSVGPSASESARKSFVNVDAFHGFSEGSDRVLRDFEGAPVAGETMQGFWRTSTAQYVTYAGQSAGDSSSFVLVTVRVYYQDRLMTTLTRLLSVEQ